MPASDARLAPYKIVDITSPLRHGMPVWLGDPPVRFDPWSEQRGTHSARVTRVTFGTHTGTHVDAPAHLLPQGASVDQLPLASMVGPCLVVEIASWPVVSKGDLETLGLPESCSRLLMRTRASDSGSSVPSVSEMADAGLTIEAAEWLVSRGMVLVGIDCPSIEAIPGSAGPSAANLPVHRVLLAAGVIVVEGLQLSGVMPGAYQFVCLPLSLVGLDGSPARAILIRGNIGATGADLIVG